MKQNFTHLTVLVLALLFTSCSKDKDESSPIEIALQDKYEVATFAVLNINASANANNPTYEWIMTKNPVDNTIDSLMGTTKDLRFITAYPGAYELTLNVKEGTKISSKKTMVNVTNEAANFNPYITSIFDFSPAPGMFANELFKTGNTKVDVMKTALGRINETSVGYQLDLGGFGGSIVVGFDHTVINVAGQKDLRLYGGILTDKANPPAPGLIYVAYDKNKNGKPDEDEWYEIIGSLHAKSTTIKGFKITYHKPANGKPLVAAGPNDPFVDREHIFCENNQGASYYLPRPKVKKEFFPAWLSETSVVFEGIKFNVNFAPARANQTTLFNFDIPEWGYVNAADPDIDLDWAVDKNGNKANLPGIDFIKIVNCVSEPMGLCQQQSSMATRFAGAADLHLLKKYNLR
ncbi:hypothetical protein [Pedobacter xixiisoli]|uniref:PKD-like domain-containing protein n=1 Tax=Pedobacter xixiisoli TaxID=1476464 RepID=A0A286A088_9SPHI|nr:hypothetical protein [Pedobacter xixiisoli]SOD15322.1 hypothetical protein SAMN06297358_2309 [Pedobacter xixiisoli]